MAQFKLEHTNIAKHKIGSQFKKKNQEYMYIFYLKGMLVKQFPFKISCLRKVLKKNFKTGYFG